MSDPDEDDMARLKRAVRYLKDAPRFVNRYHYQGKPEGIGAWADTDFAGCERTRKSTSGGIVVHGAHVIKTWSVNQAVIALSSGEAEYYGLVKAASVAIGMKSLGEDLGMVLTGKITIRSDASAAIGIANRVGIGKVRHIEVNQLWLQDKVYGGEVEIVKVKSEDNLVDALTKPMDTASIQKYIDGVGAEVSQTRHTLTPKLEYGKEEGEMEVWDEDY